MCVPTANTTVQQPPANRQAAPLSAFPQTRCNWREGDVILYLCMYIETLPVNKTCYKFDSLNILENTF
jgi:hypothetical protein